MENLHCQQCQSMMTLKRSTNKMKTKIKLVMMAVVKKVVETPKFWILLSVKTLMDLMMNHSQCSKKQRKHSKKKQCKSDFNQLLKKATILAKKSADETEAKEAQSQSNILNPDQEVSAINLSSKSAKVLLMSYSGQSAVESINREYLCRIIKELGGKVSLAKQLHADALLKAVAVKLVNHGRVKIKPEAKLSNLKRSDIIQK